MTTFGYLRVSTLQQDLEKNKTDILKFAFSKDLGNVEFIEEKISGTINWKQRQLGELINKAKDNDSIIIPELSRLARSLLQILEIMEVCKKKNIKLYSIKEGFMLDDSISSLVVSTMLGLVSQIERQLIADRTREALRIRREQGVKLGRPCRKGKSMLDEHEKDITLMLQQGKSKMSIAKAFNTSIQNLNNWIAKVTRESQYREI